jgi:hypothetical protein
LKRFSAVKSANTAAVFSFTLFDSRMPRELNELPIGFNSERPLGDVHRILQPDKV